MSGLFPDDENEIVFDFDKYMLTHTELTLHINEKLKDEFERIAKKSNLPIDNLIEGILVEFIGNYEETIENLYEDD